MATLSAARFSALRAPSGGRGIGRLVFSMRARAARGELEAGGLLGAISAERPEFADLTLDGPIWRSASSTVFIGESPRVGRVGLKICLDPRDGRPSEQAARASFAALERAAALSGGAGGLRTSVPLALLPEQGIVLSRWIDGVRFTEIARDGHTADATDAAANVGRSLALLHGSADSRLERLHVQQLLADADDRFAGAQDRQDGAVVAALRALRAGAPSAAAQPIRWGPVHGDFKPDNVIVSAGEVGVIDFEYQEPGPGLADVAHFLNHLYLASRFPQPPFWAARATLISDAFLQAYMRVGNNPTGQVLPWLRLTDALRLLAASRAAGLARRMIVGRRARHLVGHLVTELSKAPHA